MHVWLLSFTIISLSTRTCHHHTHIMAAGCAKRKEDGYLYFNLTFWGGEVGSKA
jgi:hypothetical protein